MNEKKKIILFKKKNGGKKSPGRKKLIKILVILVIAAAAVIVALNVLKKKQAAAAAASSSTVRTATAGKQDIISSLSSSGTISPKDTYSITSMADGQVIEAAFEEGDTVTEGQILYRIDASSMESELKSAGNSVDRSQSSYQSAVQDYNEAVSKYSGNTYKATKSGYIKKIYIEAGDKVGSSTQIADIYNDQIMKIKVPFLSTEAMNMMAGMEAVLTLSNTMEQLNGTILSVSSLDETMTGGRLIRYVTIQVNNPGGLTTDMSATAAVGTFTSTGEGAFTPTVDSVMGADLSGNVDVESLLVNEGEYVEAGSPIFQMKASSAEKLIKTYKDAMDSAESGLEQAQSKLDTTQDNYDDYIITAPISGKVIKKSYKVGDKIKNGSSTTELALIYDLSAVTFDMNIDELDISNVKSGQTVQVTADAFEGQQFTGTVTKVSLEGTSANGVTYYPVTVTLDDSGGLLPGMNVDGEIVLESVTDVIAVPADALVRGSKVYVKDDTVKEAQGKVPAGFREVDVETGVISSDYVEIVSGDLKEGDVVYVAASTVSQEGAAMMMAPAGGMGGAPGGNMGGGAPSGGGGSDRGYSGGSGGAPGGSH